MCPAIVVGRPRRTPTVKLCDEMMLLDLSGDTLFLAVNCSTTVTSDGCFFVKCPVPCNKKAQGSPWDLLALEEHLPAARQLGLSLIVPCQAAEVLLGEGWLAK